MNRNLLDEAYERLESLSCTLEVQAEDRMAARYEAQGLRLKASREISQSHIDPILTRARDFDLLVEQISEAIEETERQILAVNETISTLHGNLGDL